MLEVSRHALTLSTRRFNAAPHRLWTFLGVLEPPGAGAAADAHAAPADILITKRRRRARHAFAARFYDAGILFGAVAALSAVSLVLVAGFQLIVRVLELEGELEQALLAGESADVFPPASPGHVDAADGVPKAALAAADLLPGRRRDVAEPLPPQVAQGSGSAFNAKPESSSFVLTPLIPGITIPLWHVFPMVIALLLCQVIHEAGHALAAALSHVSPLSSGLALLFPGMPSAFVALPSTTLAVFSSEADIDPEDAGSGELDGVGTANGRIMPLGEQLRVISAGVWHNAATILLFAVLRPLFSARSNDHPPPLVIQGPDLIFEPLTLVLDYIYTLSLGLAVLNMLPLWGLDGEAFAERVALYLMRRRTSGTSMAQPASASLGPWNGYAASSQPSASRGPGRPGGRLLHKEQNGTQRHSGGSKSSWAALKRDEGSGGGGSFRGRGTRGPADADAGLDLEGGSAGRFAMTALNGSYGPTTVSNFAGASAGEDAEVFSHPTLATPEEEKALRALRTRTRGVLGLATIAVLGGSIVLEFVLAVQ